MDITFYSLLVFGLGFIAQVLFFSRTIVQWFQSEKAGKIISPILFWQISIIASIIMLIYGILREDFAIILGQLITFFIYIRNLQLQKAWGKIPLYFRIFAVAMPFICLGWTLLSGHTSLQSILNNDDIPTWLFIFGVTAQLVFTFRFIFQWMVSEKKKNSELPVAFWYISITGSVLILTYAIFRKDPVLLLGHLGSMVMYVRNLMLNYTGKGLFDILPFDVNAIRKKFRKTYKLKD